MWFNNCERYLQRFFEGIDLKGKNVLDVGSGNGWISVYVFMNGAKRVIGLEPMETGIREICLGSDSVSIVPSTIQEYNAQETFDLIVLHDSINHLNEEACIKLKETRSQVIYYMIFNRLFNMLNRGGKIVIADASSSSFFADLGWPNPFDRTIEWHKHQKPELWAKLLSDCGFIHPKISWLTPKKLMFLDRILSNRIASYFLVSHFRLVMWKP